MNTTQKIIFLTNIPAPYRVDFFNQLSESCDLEVIFYAKRIKNFGWEDQEKKQNFKYSFLFSNNKLKWIVDLFFILKSNREAIFVIGGYSLLPEILSIIYLKILKIEFLLNLDGGFIKSNFLRTKLKKFLIKSAKYCLSSGVNTTKTLIHYGANPNNIFEYHFSSVRSKEILLKPLNKIDKNELRKINNLSPDKFYLIFVGQLIHRKGIDILVDAMTDVYENIELLVIGDGDLLQELINKTIENNISEKIHFLGRQSKDKVLEFLKLSDVFVLPTREDIWGLVLNEAIACGLPVIATRETGAVYSLISEGGNGYLYHCNSKDKLIIHINNIYKEDLIKLGEVSLNIAKNYSTEKMVEDHISAFQIFLKEKNDNI